MSDKSTRPKRRSKSGSTRPKKPNPEFPLTPHASGKWMKKIRGDIKYFGRWGKVVNGEMVQLPGDEWWKPAYEIYKAQADDLHAGRTPRVPGQAALVKHVCEKLLVSKKRKMESGGISPRTFAEYKSTTDRLYAMFGERYVDDLRADDFEKLRSDIAKRFGPDILVVEANRVVTISGPAKDSTVTIEA